MTVGSSTLRATELSIMGCFRVRQLRRDQIVVRGESKRKYILFCH